MSFLKMTSVTYIALDKDDKDAWPPEEVAEAGGYAELQKKWFDDGESDLYDLLDASASDEDENHQNSVTFEEVE